MTPVQNSSTQSATTANRPSFDFSNIPVFNYTPEQISGLYDIAQVQGRAEPGSGSEQLFVNSYNDALARQGTSQGSGGGSGSGSSAEDKRLAELRKMREEEQRRYSEQGAALTAELLGSLAARRRAADEELQFAMEREKTQSERLKLAATTAREQTTREFRTISEDMMRMLAGRGTARSPMVAGRGARRLQMQKDERFGRISQTLADEISALQEMVQMAERLRAQEISRISQEEALARTAPQLLLPAAAAFGGS
jgi:hypothetical protein